MDCKINSARMEKEVDCKINSARMEKAVGCKINSARRGEDRGVGGFVSGNKISNDF